MQEININQATLQRVTTIDTKGGGFAILITTTNAVSDEALVNLMRNRGSVFKLSLERLQQDLLPGDDVNAGVMPTTERVWETSSGDVVKAHVYQSTSGDGLCDLCGHPTSHEAHNEAAVEAGRIAAAGDRLIAATESETPAEVTPEQEEGRAALASRSRSNRNGPAA